MYDASHTVYSDRLHYELGAAPADAQTLDHLHQLRDVAAASGFDGFAVTVTDAPAAPAKQGRHRRIVAFGDLHSKLICVALAGVYGFYDVVQLLTGA